VPQNNAVGETGIRRYFDIQPGVSSNAQASLRFYYFDDELNGKDKDALAVFSTRNGLQDWALSGKDNAAAGWVVKNGITQLSRFTLADAKK